MYSNFIKSHLVIILLGINTLAFGQLRVARLVVDSLEATDSNRKKWQNINKASLDISEVTFVNWNGGGTNSISGLLGLEFQRNFKKNQMVWENRVVVRYGVNKQQSQDLSKTDDILEIHSRFGFRKNKVLNWYYSANFSLKLSLLMVTIMQTVIPIPFQNLWPQLMSF